MKRLVSAALAIVIVVMGLAANSVWANDVSTVVQFDPDAGEFPEGLAVGMDGNVYLGMAPTGEIKRITPEGEVSTFANLPSPPEGGFMLGLEFSDEGDLYVAMSSFDPETHGIWRVSGDGSTTERFAELDVAGFPNVVTFDSEGNLYASDSIGGAVRKVDPQGNVSTWKADPLLRGLDPPGPAGIPIGANGLAFDEGEEYLYVAVTDFGRIVRIPVNADGSAGEAEVFVESTLGVGLPDGIIFGDDGKLYVAAVGSDRITAISPDGTAVPVAQGGMLQNPSDLRFGVGEDANTLYIANFAVFRLLGLMPGTPEPALLKVTVEPSITPPRVGDAYIGRLSSVALALGMVLFVGGALVLRHRRAAR